jgi:hypothetical protein
MCVQGSPIMCTHGQLYMCKQGSPAEIQTPTTGSWSAATCCPTARVIAQQYSVATFVSLRLNFFYGSTTLEGLGLLIVEASRSHFDTPHSVGLPWTCDQPDAETSTCQHITLTTDWHPCGIRTHNPNKRTAEDPRLRPRGHWHLRLHHRAEKFGVGLKNVT